MFCAEDSKGSPEPVTHLQWDDPYYDIARHHIVEVAGSGLSVFSSDVFAAGLQKRLSNGAVGASALCQSQVTMTAGIIKRRSTKRLECYNIFCWTLLNLRFFLVLTVLIILLAALGCFCWIVLDIALGYILSTRCVFCMIMPQKLPSYAVQPQSPGLTEQSTVGLAALLCLNGQSLPSCPERAFTEIWNGE